MRIARIGFAAALLLVTFPETGSAEEEVARCLEDNMPEPDSIRALRVVARDRTGAERVTVVKLYGARSDEGYRQLLLRFIEPADVAGAAFLMLERPEQNETYFKPGPDQPPKRITGAGSSMALFGSDFSYEDFEYLHGFTRPGETKRLEDAAIDDRAVYVLETRPSAEAQSAYQTIVAFVDKETCIPLRMEMFEVGGRLRKVLSVNPSQVMKRGPVWIAHRALMRDIRDYTTTQLLVDSTEQDSLPDETFSVEALRAP